VAEFGGALRHRVEHLERRHQFPRAVHLDLDATTAHFGNETRQRVGAGAQADEGQV